MIGWNPRPFIFIHIPKCAGTSIEAALIPMATSQAQLSMLSLEERNKFWLPSNHELQHSKLRDFSLKYPIRDYYKFTFVRNPWDRAVSQIDYLLRSKTSEAVFSGNGFKDYCNIYCQTKACIGGQDLGACQLDYVLDRSGKVGMDFIGRFESLAADYKKVCTTLGLAPDQVMPHLKKSNRELHYRKYYDAESREWVRRRFLDDIKYFNYKF